MDFDNLSDTPSKGQRAVYYLCTQFTEEYTDHCQSGEGLWLQGDAALQRHICRDAEPQPVIPQNKEKTVEHF